MNRDVVVVGAGPAGLSAALILGRCCRTVLVCDRGTPRSWASKAMHGFTTRDGVPPDEFRRAAIQELERYPAVSLWRGEVTFAKRDGNGFIVQLGNETVRARKLLIATGVMDQLPEIEGLAAAFGISVFQCPYCDGWEVRGQPTAVYGRQKRGLEMARAVRSWTQDILLCTDGPSGFTTEETRGLMANGIRIAEERLSRLEHDHGKLSAVVFRDGTRVEREVLFFDTPSRGQSHLTEQLGCRFNRHGGVICGQYEATSVPGVYVAGNITRNVQLSIVAAAEGANAAFGINRALTREDFERNATGVAYVEHTGPDAGHGARQQI
ncbi:MAG: NAD(P)/FAD-dependent oxidoreductase [Steroidobacteraceae bacterium]